MSENAPSNPQFVGQADGRKAEAPVMDEFTLSPEQQHVVDVMQSAGKKLEGAELDAREKAADGLKQLQGKELVDAGFKQMGHGVWETVKSQVKWAAGGGLITGVGLGFIGGSTWILMNQSEESRRSEFASLSDDDLSSLLGLSRDRSGSLGKAVKVSGYTGVIAGAQVGEAIGFQAAGLEYNKNVATKNNVPPARWYDWVASNVGLTGLKMLIDGRGLGTAGEIGKYVLSDIFNPITVGGMRNVATGLWQMKKG